MIFDHMDRSSPSEYKLGRTKQEKISHYVDLFFDDVLKQAHHNDANRLLSRERLIRSAYLFYLREALPQKTAKNAVTSDEASEDLEDTEE